MAARPLSPIPSLDRVEMGLRYKRLRDELRASDLNTDFRHVGQLRAEFEQLGRAIDAEDRRRSSLNNLPRAPLSTLARD